MYIGPTARGHVAPEGGGPIYRNIPRGRDISDLFPIAMWLLWIPYQPMTSILLPGNEYDVI